MSSLPAMGPTPLISLMSSQFFGSAFMSFMAVAYVPAYLEDFAVFRKDRANGLYGATQFNIANFLIGLPYLCEYCHPWPRRPADLSRVQSASLFSSP
jgi:hypothetical protein